MVYYEIVRKQERHQSVTPTADIGIKANSSNTKFTKKVFENTVNQKYSDISKGKIYIRYFQYQLKNTVEIDQF